jgi:hypothetical protein
LFGLFGFALFAQQPSVTYFDFESAKNPVFANAGGSWEGVVDNPLKAGANVSDSVGSTLTGAAAWDGIQIELGGFVDLRTENKFTMLVYHPTLTGETRLHFKGAKELKLDQQYTTPGAWQEITWEIPLADDGSYDKVLLCFAHERSAADELWYFDLLKGTPVYPVPPPATYYSTVNYRKDWAAFQSAVFEGVVANPVSDAVNSYPFAGKALTGTDTWSGMYFDLPGSIDFTETHKFEMNVLSDSVGNVRIQLEAGAAEKMKISVPYTTPGEWANLVFDANDAISGSTDIDYTRMVLIFDDADTDAGEVWYFDMLGGPLLNIGDADPAMTYYEFDEKPFEFFGFQSAAWGGIMTNPMKDAVNGSDSVGVSYTGTDTWSGIYNDLATSVDFSEGFIFTMKVYSDSIGEARFQLEKRGDASNKPRLLVPYTTPGEWADLKFDMRLATGGKTTDDYFNRVVLIFDALDKDIGEEWFFDDVKGPNTTPVYYTNGIFKVTNVNGSATTFAIQINNGDAITLNNDGTNGDEVADDNIWSVMVPNLPVGDHVMDVWADGALISSADDMPFTIPETYADVTIDYSYDVTGVEVIKSEGFTVYPNPAYDRLTVRMNSGMINGICVYNIQGSEVRKINFINSGEYTLNMADLKTGMYFVKVDGVSGQSEVIKILKK